MKRLALAALLAPTLASPAYAAPEAAAQAPAPVFEILKATDKDMTCEQLAAEYNKLNAAGEKAKADEVAKAKKSQNASMMLGLASGLAGGLLGGGRGGGGFGTYGASALSQAAASASIAGAQNQTASIYSGAMAGLLGPQTPATPQQQRAERMMELYQSKAC